MWEYFMELSVFEKSKIIGGAFIGVGLFFLIFWGAAITCVAFGGAPEVCGM